ncbi:unnamed protein product [Phaeothamnion confervicola]
MYFLTKLPAHRHSQLLPLTFARSESWSRQRPQKLLQVWNVTEEKADEAAHGGGVSSRLVVDLFVKFSKSTWLKGKIERDTLAETGEALRAWVALAITWIERSSAAVDPVAAGAAATGAAAVGEGDSVVMAGTEIAPSEVELVAVAVMEQVVMEKAGEALDALPPPAAATFACGSSSAPAAPSGARLVRRLSTGESLAEGEFLVGCDSVSVGDGASAAAAPGGAVVAECKMPSAYLTVSAGLAQLVKGGVPAAAGGEVIWSSAGARRRQQRLRLLRLLGNVLRGLSRVVGRRKGPPAGPCNLRLRDDGRLELVAGNRRVWRSPGTREGFGRYTAVVTGDGRLAVLLDGRRVWEVGSGSGAADS